MIYPPYRSHASTTPRGGLRLVPAEPLDDEAETTKAARERRRQSDLVYVASKRAHREAKYDFTLVEQALRAFIRSGMVKRV